MARYALVIGIAEYDSSSLPTLKKSATDAEAVAQALERYGNFQEVIRLPSRWISDENRYEIVSKKLTGQELSQALKTFLLEQAVKQEALIYFAGHGFQALSSMGVQNGYLATSNCAIDGRNAIPLDEFNWLISQSDLSSLVVLLDCCHAGSLLERNLLEPTLTAFDKKPDYYFITACRSFEKAYEGKEHGIFTGAVLKGLSLENADKDRQVSSDRLFDYIRRELKGSGQEPIRMGRGRSITLVTYSAANPAPNLPSVSPSQPVQPANPVSRSGDGFTNFVLKRLWTRRLVLASIVLLAIGAGIFFLTQKNPIIQLTDKCEFMSQKSNTLKIAIANFYNANPEPNNSLLTEKRLLDRLKAEKPDNVEVCLANETVSTSTEAQILGKKLEATIIIWGRRDVSSFDIYLKGINYEQRYLARLSVPAMDALDYGLQTQDWPGLITVMAAFGLSQNYYFNNQFVEARQVLADALKMAELRDLSKRNKHNAQVLAQAYFFLGVMFSAGTDPNCEKALNDCMKAVEAYRKASNLDEKLYQALLNQGLLYKQLKQLDEAVEAFSQVINSDSKSPAAVEALVYRSDILIEQGKIKAAIKDLEIVCQQEPENLEYRHFLGLAQLQAGQTLEAKQTYQYVKRYLDSEKDLKTEIIDDLNSIAEQEKTPELSKVISNITSTL
ncbi:caspase family protein [Trichocoleus sp. ST-U3]